MEDGRKIITAPIFPGCGFVDRSFGDLLVGDTLYEVKSGDRNFRLMDVKQILVYLALNIISHSHDINYVGFVNPRVGIYYKLGISDFAYAISGKNMIQLLSDIIEFVSSGGVSR